MANQQEQKLAQYLVNIAKALQPTRRIENGTIIIDYGNGQSISLPMYTSNIERVTTASSR